MVRRSLITLALALLLPSFSLAAAPDWLKSIARSPLPAYPADTKAVTLLSEQHITVTENGDLKIFTRRAYKVLNTSGRGMDTVAVWFDNSTRLTSMKAWTLPLQGNEYELKEKDAVETGVSGGGVLYGDTRYKILSLPAVEPGSVVGYEYEQIHQPKALQEHWDFQEEIPVRVARYVLKLPEGWEMKPAWRNHIEVSPQVLDGNAYMWELHDLPGIKTENSMPTWRAVAGQMSLKFYPSKEKLQGRTHSDWEDVGRWYWQLIQGRRDATAEMQQKAVALTSGGSDVMAKMRMLAGYAQRSIRYVAIEIGIGGWQPHHARDIFTNSYGDCKDKATLLSAMLNQIGVDSYMVLVHTQRGVVAPEFPSLTFNHAILAVKLPPQVATDKLYATVDHPKLGRLLFFDPTDSTVPLGYLPTHLQDNYGLVVIPNGGELIKMPLHPAQSNQLVRRAKLQLTPTGGLSGEVTETRTGPFAADRRSLLLARTAEERQKYLESFLGSFVTGIKLRDFKIDKLEDYDDELVVTYSFETANYAKPMSDLLLLRPRVFGQKSDTVLEGEERKYPVELDSSEFHLDEFEFVLPAGYQADELPRPADLQTDFARYQSKAEVAEGTLRYRREFEIKQVMIPLEKIPELKKFYRGVAADERSSAVLKKVVQ